MPIAPDPRRIGRPLRLAGVLAATVLLPASLVLAGCGRSESPISPSSPEATASSSASPGDSAGPDQSASPDPDDTATPTVSGSPDPSATSDGSATPGASSAPSDAASGPTMAPVSCTSVTPIRVERSTVEPRRTTEVVTVVSDGRTLTPGTREQTDFTAAQLLAPDGTTTIDDGATLAKIAGLIEKASKHTVQLRRPDAPDSGIDTGKRPFNATGTFVLYRASGVLTADVVVKCSDQEQRWRFTAEADSMLGTVNCAVEPPRGNAVARQVYGSFC